MQFLSPLILLINSKGMLQTASRGAFVSSHFHCLAHQLAVPGILIAAPAQRPFPERLLCYSLWLLLRARSREGWQIEPHKRRCICMTSRVSQNAELQGTVKCLWLPWWSALFNECSKHILGDPLTSVSCQALGQQM